MPPARRYVAVVIGLVSTVALGLLGFAFHFDALWTPALLARFQLRDPGNTILPADLRYNAAFKLAHIAARQPDVICIGTSRAGTLRDRMFEPYRFHNASFTAWTTGQLLDVFEHLTRDVRPRVVIIAIDYFLFTDRWNEAYDVQRRMNYKALDYVRFKFVNLINALPSPVPFQEQHRKDGFNRDGSYLYPAAFVTLAREKLQTAQRLVESSPGAPEMSPRQKAPIVKLASLARQRGIRIVAVQLPYVRSAVDYLDHDESYRVYAGIWREFESEQTASWLRGLGFAFFDLAHSPLADDPDNFIDAFHPSETGMARLLGQLSKEPEFQTMFPHLKAAE